MGEPEYIVLEPVYNREAIAAYMERHKCKTADEAAQHIRGRLEALDELGKEFDRIIEQNEADLSSGPCEAVDFVSARSRFHAEASQEFMGWFGSRL